MGKAFEAAVLGKMPAGPASFFPSGLAGLRRAKPEGKKDRSFGSATQAALRLAWAMPAVPGFRCIGRRTLLIGVLSALASNRRWFGSCLPDMDLDK